MNFLLVGLGGALGSVTRYYLDRYLSNRVETNYPIGIFSINLTGAFVLGFVQNMLQNPAGTLFIATGFLGAFTTFSTFLWQFYSLGQESRKKIAGTYFTMSIVLGIAFFIAGYRLRLMI